MLDVLNYDQEGTASTETNALKMTAHCINKFVISKMTAELAAENIQSHLSELANIEADQNCIPVHIAAKHIDLALSYFIGKPSTAPKKSGTNPSVSPLYDASSWVSVFEVVHNVLLAFECGYFSIDIKFNASREKFLDHLFCTALGGKNMTPKQQWSNVPEVHPTDHNPYSTMFVFDSGDLDAAAHCVVTSIEDPLIPWRIRSIYVQETCYENFCSKLKTKLRGYAAEILRDYAFIEDFQSSVEELKKMKVKVIQPHTDHCSGDIVPTICCELGREYFDKNGKLSPIIVLKSIRTVKEGITLAKRETGGLATIWTHNISLAYEIVNNSDFTTFWINCLGQMQKSIPFTFRQNKNCIGSNLAPLEWFIKHSYIDGKELQSEDKQILDALKSGTKIENNYHFEYFVTAPNQTGKECQGKKETTKDAFADLVDLSDAYWKNLSVLAAQWKRKTVVFPFGVTFAN